MPEKRERRTTEGEQNEFRHGKFVGKKSVTVEWIKADWFCPSCGRHDMWQAIGDGDDYDHGYSATCFSCKATLCCVGKVEDDDA